MNVGCVRVACFWPPAAILARAKPAQDSNHTTIHKLTLPQLQHNYNDYELHEHVVLYTESTEEESERTEAPGIASFSATKTSAACGKTEARTFVLCLFNPEPPIFQQANLPEEYAASEDIWDGVH